VTSKVKVQTIWPLTINGTSQTGFTRGNAVANLIANNIPLSIISK
jgi:hypothetical protein